MTPSGRCGRDAGVSGRHTPARIHGAAACLPRPRLSSKLLGINRALAPESGELALSLLRIGPDDPLQWVEQPAGAFLMFRRRRAGKAWAALTSGSGPCGLKMSISAPRVKRPGHLCIGTTPKPWRYIRERTPSGLSRWRFGSDIGMVVFLSMQRSTTTHWPFGLSASLLHWARCCARREGFRAKGFNVLAVYGPVCQARLQSVLRTSARSR